MERFNVEERTWPEQCEEHCVHTLTQICFPHTTNAAEDCLSQMISHQQGKSFCSQSQNLRRSSGLQCLKPASFRSTEEEEEERRPSAKFGQISCPRKPSLVHDKHSLDKFTLQMRILEMLKRNFPPLHTYIVHGSYCSHYVSYAAQLQTTKWGEYIDK